MSTEVNPYLKPEGEIDIIFDYRRLKAEAMQYLETLTTDSWTDFNHHDPGITILEQLCYALTDLAFRTSYSIADLLTDPLTRRIDTKKQALYTADEVLTNAPLTAIDYIKLVYDNVLGVANAWLEPIQESPLGRYQVWIYVYDLEHYQTPEAIKRIIADTENVLHQNRNLCEDFENISVLKFADVHISADIVIESGYSAEEILGDIYFRISKALAPEIHFHSYQDMLEDGLTIDEIFDGPPLSYGFIRDQELKPHPRHISQSRIINLITSVEGVKNIRAIDIEPANEGDFEHGMLRPDRIFRFANSANLPREETRIRLITEGTTRHIQADPKVTQRVYERLQATSRRVYQLTEQYKKYLAPPDGKVITWEDYDSIQHQFPRAYGINKYGIPEFDKDHNKVAFRRAQAKQLKAYLVLFEQLMADFLAQVGYTRQNLSIEGVAGNTYATQYLGDDIIPNISPVYGTTNTDPDIETDDEKRERIQDYQTALNGLVSMFDENKNRRSQMMDYLMGLYGEHFSQYSLTRLGVYYSDEDWVTKIIRNKVAFLTDMIALNRNRGQGVNLLLPESTENMAGVKRKASLLLDMDAALDVTEGCRTSAVFEECGLRLITEKRTPVKDCYEFDADGTVLVTPVNASAVRQHFTPIVGKINFGTKDPQINPYWLFARQKWISDAMLRSGIHLENYRVGTAANNRVILALKTEIAPRGTSTGDQEKDAPEFVWRKVGEFDRKEIARKEAINMACFMRHLSRKCEHFYVVEHTLLRDAPNMDEDPGFRLSIVFTGFTARCGDERFRQLMFDTFFRTLPAHTVFELIPVDSEEMCEFELTWNEWQSALNEHTGHRAKAAGKLWSFLKHKKHQEDLKDLYGSTTTILNQVFKAAEDLESGNREVFDFYSYSSTDQARIKAGVRSFINDEFRIYREREMAFHEQVMEMLKYLSREKSVDLGDTFQPVLVTEKLDRKIATYLNRPEKDLPDLLQRIQTSVEKRTQSKSR